MLLERPGDVVTREEICRLLWPDGTVVEFDHSIGTAVKKLRQALGDEAESPRYVETLPRRGFRFIFPDVESLDTPPILTAPAPAPAATSSRLPLPLQPETSAAIADPPSRQHRSRHSRRYVAFAALVAVVGICGWLAWRSVVAPKPPRDYVMDESSLSQVTASPGLDLYPSFSPDGSSLAYSSDQNGDFEIYVKSLTPGGRDVQLTSDGAENLEPTWSPDGKLIAYHSRKRGAIWVLPALGGSARMVSDFGSAPAWSPDSSKIVFQSAPLSDMGQTALAMPPSTLWVVSLKSGALMQLTRAGNPSGGHGSPSWSPDGRRIVFGATSTGLGGRDLVSFGRWRPAAATDGRQGLLSRL